MRLTPRGGRDAIEGIETLADGRSVLKARVRALPSEGEANAALIALLAAALRIPARNIALHQGATGRIKTLQLTGETAELVARLRELAGRARGGGHGATQHRA